MYENSHTNTVRSNKSTKVAPQEFRLALRSSPLNVDARIANRNCRGATLCEIIKLPKSALGWAPDNFAAKYCGTYTYSKTYLTTQIKFGAHFYVSAEQ